MILKLILFTVFCSSLTNVSKKYKWVFGSIQMFRIVHQIFLNFHQQNITLMTIINAVAGVL